MRRVRVLTAIAAIAWLMGLACTQANGTKPPDEIRASKDSPRCPGHEKQATSGAYGRMVVAAFWTHDDPGGRVGVEIAEIIAERLREFLSSERQRLKTARAYPPADVLVAETQVQNAADADALHDACHASLVIWGEIAPTKPGAPAIAIQDVKLGDVHLENSILTITNSVGSHHAYEVILRATMKSPAIVAAEEESVKIGSLAGMQLKLLKPTKPLALFRLATLFHYVELGDLDAAGSLVAADDISIAIPGEVGAVAEYFIAYSHSFTNSGKTIEHSRRGLDLAPAGNGELRALLNYLHGTSLCAAGVQSGMDYLDEAIAWAEKSGDLRLHIQATRDKGEFFRHWGDLQAAEPLLRKAVALRMQLGESPHLEHFYLARLLLQTDEKREGERLIRRSIRKLSGSFLGFAQHELGSLALSRGDVDEARKQFRGALSTLEKYAVHQDQAAIEAADIADLFVATSQYPDAVAFYEISLKHMRAFPGRDPATSADELHVRARLALASHMAGETRQARKLVESVVGEVGNLLRGLQTVDVHASLALYFLTVGDWKAAQRHEAEYLAIAGALMCYESADCSMLRLERAAMLASGAGWPEGRPGLLIVGCVSETPCERLGLENGDIVTHLGTREVTDPSQLQGNELGQLHGPATVWRSFAQKEVKLATSDQLGIVFSSVPPSTLGFTVPDPSSASLAPLELGFPPDWTKVRTTAPRELREALAQLAALEREAPAVRFDSLLSVDSRLEAMDVFADWFGKRAFYNRNVGRLHWALGNRTRARRSYTAALELMQSAIVWADPVMRQHRAAFGESHVRGNGWPETNNFLGVTWCWHPKCDGDELLPGDLVVELDGQTSPSFKALLLSLYSLKGRRRVPVVVRRDAQLRRLRISRLSAFIMPLEKVDLTDATRPWRVRPKFYHRDGASLTEINPVGPPPP